MPDRRTKTAFVLSGGASLGSIQAGMLEALYERGIRPDLIVGTSAGALNGAFVASRRQSVETAHALGEVWKGLRRGQVFPLSPLAGALGLFGARSHLVPDSGLARVVRRHLTVARLEEAPIPLHVIATDVQSGAEVRLSEGSLLDAVMASSAIPGVLPPVEWDGRHLVDGGVSNNVPISHAVDLGADLVYVLPTGAACELEEPPRGALATLIQATSLLIGHRFAADIAELSKDAELVLLPPPCPLAVQPTDFGRAGELIDTARRDARRFLDHRESRPSVIGAPAGRALAQAA